MHSLNASLSNQRNNQQKKNQPHEEWLKYTKEQIKHKFTQNNNKIYTKKLTKNSNSARRDNIKRKDRQRQNKNKKYSK